ncbi:hypothetical protein SDRG_08095 [Saprolegnia diclina VS20]|uniref:AB hydrolase-1 domain-containing protein n=1 Tax=Saprolegnia diclina (strain VS20) TaxID=1156394 RepID=T0RV90_SAPDV|nr:hypothetical protein SDRG_08095 [Saprolegnia diclina VS20]EQC34322.1 hypothetical protein SDRG_08095 [Saprolegnia diclina VS20]|eukprot:XP_008612184.1 hypothetical protein SDRG_08095 [Saprolegnia diclina VS20]
MPDDRKPRLTAHESLAAPSRLLLAKLPALHEAFRPTWFLPNGHCQTIMTHSLNVVPRKVVHYERELVRLVDGGTVSLDWASPKARPANLATLLDDRSAPTIVLMHGLGGGSHESYIQLTAKRCLAAGFRVVVMNARGCAKTPVTTPKLVCPAVTADVKEVVAHLRATSAPAPTPLIAVGYSLGANILLKYVGEAGNLCLLTAAISLANPYDLEMTTAHLATSWWHRQIYNKALTSGLVKLIFKKSNAHAVLCTEATVNLKQLKKARILEDFDRAYSCPVFGYETPLDIYKDASSAAYIAGIAIPTLCLSALDDPICPRQAIPYDVVKANPNVLLAVTTHGGHLGYYTRNALDTWYIKAIVQFAIAVKPTVDADDDLHIVLTP